MTERNYVELKPIKETTEDFEACERRIKELFKAEIYFPLLASLTLTKTTLTNEDEENALIAALRSGRITFYRGAFAGKFNAAISKELKRLGARFDKRTATFKILVSELPMEVRHTISASEYRFIEKMAGIDRKLAQIVPEQIAAKLKVADLFDRTLWKTDQAFRQSVKGITVSPELPPEQRKKIADEWQQNMELWIKDFTEKEIVQLRTNLQKAIYSGNRYESTISTIQKSYGVSANKAKFLARQETSLLMTKFKQTRYQAAGVNEYKWGRVAGTPAHPVRPRHKELAAASERGTIYRWDAPPVSTAPGEPERRNNPGQDYNCRCFAKPIVRFTK